MKLGVIGYGSRIRTVIGEMMKLEPSCRVVSIVDIRKAEMTAERRKFDLDDSTRFYDTPEEMLEAGGLDGILIGTRCSLHTEMALRVMPAGIPIYLEKPVSTTMPDLLRLKTGFERHRTPVVVSFPLRVTSIVRLVKEIVDSGKIGRIEHAQAVTNVPYGGDYFQSWYRDENETGGLFLQKATHDFDYIGYVLGQQPTTVAAMTSKQIFKGTKPAGLKCVDCGENRTCQDSILLTKNPKWEYCCYAEDTGNEDSGSVLIRYESGMHVAYSQNFFVRRDAGARGARFMGYKGTLEFDFFTGVVRVFMHHAPRTETYEIKPGEGHFGGDSALADNFIRVMRGEAEPFPNLEDGLRSALLCLKAKASAETGTFQTVEWR